MAELPAEEGALVPNPAVGFPKRPLLPAGADSLDPKAPPPAPEEKLNPEAEPNAGVDVGLSEVGALKEKEVAEAAEGPPEDEPKPEPKPEEEPNPDGGCVGATGFCPNPNEEPNPLLPAAKLKVLAWTGAGAALPNPKFWNTNMAICSTDAGQLPPLQIDSIPYEDALSLPLLSKEDAEDPNPAAGVEPKPPVDALGKGLFNSASYRKTNDTQHHHHQLLSIFIKHS